MSEDVHQALQALRAQGADLHDPVRFRYMEALATRMQAQPPSVQRLLADKLDAAVADYRSRLAHAPHRPTGSGLEAAVPSLPPSPSSLPSPLALLNRDIAQRVKEGAGEAWSGETGSPSDMKSVRRFAEVWSKIATEQQLTQALNRGPEAAGPLNSHHLMLRAMSLMHGLSPAYLRRFLAQADALLWLDQVHQQTKDNKAARRGRVGKKPG